MSIKKAMYIHQE